MTDANLIEIFCILDEFCKYFAPELKKHTLGKNTRLTPAANAAATARASCQTAR